MKATFKICIKIYNLVSLFSYYGTEKAIERFENYKKDGAVMKKKYLNKEINEKDFEEWIKKSKKNKIIT